MKPCAIVPTNHTLGKHLDTVHPTPVRGTPEEPLYGPRLTIRDATGRGHEVVLPDRCEEIGLGEGANTYGSRKLKEENLDLRKYKDGDGESLLN